ncbi:MAG: pantetheine-phosphate adenylyltransferase [Bacteroidales bacterium]|nr:pantetheine-phosphate adenylyltransferase [Bacteroidales bacterium]
MNKAIFPGSFDPFTVGHENIVLRGLNIFDHIVIAVGINSDKRGMFTIEQRLHFIKEIFKDEPRVSVETYTGLTVDYAKQTGCTHILRGLRTAADFEFERAIAQVNKQMSGLDTSFLLCIPEHTPVNSSIVRDILHHHGDASMYVPVAIREEIKQLSQKR